MTTLEMENSQQVTSVSQHDRLLGCLLGTALGDSVGLAREGLSRGRAERWFSSRPLRPNLIVGRGFCSDDTEHTQIVGRALALSQGYLTDFEQELARHLRRWIATLPAGVGLATLRACLKLLVGVPPSRSGVPRAGNGPAMRSALIGVWAKTDEELCSLVGASTRITHTDPRAEEGARLVARAARGTDLAPLEFLQRSCGTIEGEELRRHIEAACHSLQQGDSPARFADSQGWTRGVSGYVNHTVPAALMCWAWAPDDFRLAIETAVCLGGDTDSVAAITGGVWGAHRGAAALPGDWLELLAEWPRGVAWMERLAKSLDREDAQTTPPPMMWGRTLLRNIPFAAAVLLLGFRRLLPPY